MSPDVNIMNERDKSLVTTKEDQGKAVLAVNIAATSIDVLTSKNQALYACK